MNHRLTTAILCAALPLGVVAVAQTTATPPASNSGAAANSGAASSQNAKPAPVERRAPRPRRPRPQPISIAPYSATFTETNTQKLQDGTVLSHTETRTVARDSKGRLREQFTVTGDHPPMDGHMGGGPMAGHGGPEGGPGGGPGGPMDGHRGPGGPDAGPHHGASPEHPSGPTTFVVITDPIAHTVIRFDEGSKHAFVQNLPGMGMGIDEGEEFGMGMDHGRNPGPEPGGQHERHGRQGGAPGHGSRHEGGNPEGNGEVRPSGSESDPNTTLTDLGTKSIAGVNATGRRVTHSIPAGEIGNNKPIVSTQEEWFSPDLGIVVSETDTDPFRGTHTFTVSGLTRTEPDASLFTLPGGYTLHVVPFGGGWRHGGMDGHPHHGGKFGPGELPMEDGPGPNGEDAPGEDAPPSL